MGIMDICGSARDNAEGLGVSAFGEDVIKEMNRVGMMVDISHAGEKVFMMRWKSARSRLLPRILPHVHCATIRVT